MKAAIVRIPGKLREEVEKHRRVDEDEKFADTTRRVIRAGLTALKEEK